MPEPSQDKFAGEALHAKQESHKHAAEQRRAKTKRENNERKHRLQSDGRSAVTRSIAQAVVLKDRDLFFLSEEDGSVPLKGEHGLGLYYHDCRYLSGYEFKFGTAKPTVLVCTAISGFGATLELTNPDLRIDNQFLIRKDEIGIQLERLLDSDQPALRDVFKLRNYGRDAVDLPLHFVAESTFESLFVVRGQLAQKLGYRHPPSWENGRLILRYDGADKIERILSIRFSPMPHFTRDNSARFEFKLEPREEKELCVTFTITEGRKQVVPQNKPPPGDMHEVKERLEEYANHWLESTTQIRSNSSLLNDVVKRSLRDLYILKTSLEGEQFFAAGVPWYVTLFGRDSLIASLQTLAYKPEIAEQTLRLMAKYQGKKIDHWRDEEPGKIMHELRVGEMAYLNEIPQTPYYGTIDATPLFLVLLARHAAWTGELRLFEELRDHVEAALSWIADNAEKNHDGYLKYQSSSKNGLSNQGWKDSGDAIVNEDGSLAEPPISLVEVQGYVYLAKVSLADLYERAGESERARQLRDQAEALRSRFNRDFWIEERQFYALALQAENRRAAAISSNPGQALWTGIIDPKNARPTVERLLSEDMFSGWGIRTLSAKEPRYNPIGYHLGTVWPHDNSLIAAGFRHYGFDEEACRIFSALVEAAQNFAHYRLPEVFAGFQRESYGVPVRYPVACHPQAWAAGAVPYLIQAVLGLMPEAFEHRLRIRHPVLPQSIRWLELHGLRIGKARADLRFERAQNGAVHANVLKVNGELDVVIENKAMEPSGGRQV
jgi:glycogen debranching enzyme